MGQAKNATPLEKRRIRAAKVTLAILGVLCVVLSLWRCAEDLKAGSSLSSFMEIIEESETQDADLLNGEQNQSDNGLSSNGALDPLRLNQEGIVLMRSNAEASILWYQSNWDVSQSRVLLERALVYQGWQPLHAGDDQIMSFVYDPHALAGGGSLLASLYPNDTGCSILIETM